MLRGHTLGGLIKDTKNKKEKKSPVTHSPVKPFSLFESPYWALYLFSHWGSCTMSSYCPGCLVGSGSDTVDDVRKSFPGDSSCEGSVLVCCFELVAS